AFAWFASSRYFARYSGAEPVSGSGAKTRGVHASDRSMIVSPFAEASSTHTLPFASPAVNTGTVLQPARAGANGLLASAMSTGAELDAAAEGALVDALCPSSTVRWQAPSARVKRPTAPRRPRTDEECSRP